MKKLLFLTALTLMAGNVMADDLYLSASGNDSNDGTSTTAAVATLGKALELAKNGDVIHVDGMVKSVSSLEVAGDNRNLVFEGTDATNDGLDGDLQYRIVRFTGGINVTFRNLSICNGRFTPASGNEGGAAIHSGGTIKLENCLIYNNQTTVTANAHGGAFRIGGNLILKNCEAYDNAGCGGGVVEMRGGNLTVENCYFHDNIAKSWNGSYNGDARGGAIESCDVTTTKITGTRFENNTAYAHGGALDVIGTGSKNLILSECTFTNNYSGGSDDTFAQGSNVFPNGRNKQGNGGAFYANTAANDSNPIDNYNWLMEHVTFDGNSSGGQGGAVCTETKVNLTMSDVVVKNNVCMNAGGGGMFIKNQDGTFVIENSKILNNDAITGTYTRGNANSNNSNIGTIYANGGGIQFDQAKDVVIRNCVIDGNACYANGGGVRFCGGGNQTGVLVENTTFVNNMAGGRLNTFTGTDDWIMQTVPGKGRDEDRHGAAVMIESNGYVADATLSFVGCTFANNSTTNSGGAIRVENCKEGQTLNITNCTITGNEVVRHGAGNGAGIWVNDKTMKVVIKNSVLDQNRYYSKKDVVDGYNDAKWDKTPIEVYSSYIGSINDWTMDGKYVQNGTTVVDEKSMLNVTGQNPTEFQSGLRTLKTTEEGHAYVPLTIGTAATTMGTVETGIKDILGKDWVKSYIGSVQYAELPFSVSEYGYATLYYSTDAMVVPEGLTAKTYKVEDDKLTESMVYEAGNVIPAATGVVLEGTEGDYLFTSTFENGSLDADNQLRGSDEDAETTGGSKYYKLGVKDAANPGFYWGAENGAAFTNKAHKAYLVLNNAAARSAYIFGEDTATGINTIVSSTESTAIYNLQGCRVTGQIKKGLYIVNGKKTMVK